MGAGGRLGKYDMLRNYVWVFLGKYEKCKYPCSYFPRNRRFWHTKPCISREIRWSDAYFSGNTRNAKIHVRISREARRLQYKMLVFPEKYDGQGRISREILTFYIAIGEGLGKYNNFGKFQKISKILRRTSIREVKRRGKTTNSMRILRFSRLL